MCMAGKKVSLTKKDILKADLMAARIEFEREWLPKLKQEKTPISKIKITPTNSKKDQIRNKALGSIKSNNLKNLLDSL